MSLHKRQSFVILLSLFAVLMFVIRASAQDWRESHLLWHPTKDIIAISNGYLVNFYNADFQLLDQFIIADPQQNVVAEFTMQWSPTGDELAIRISSNLQNPHALQIWNLATGNKRIEISDIEPQSNFSWKPDGTQIAAVHTRGYMDVHVVIYNAITGETITDLMPDYTTNWIPQLTWIDNEHLMITTSGKLEYWNIVTKSILTVTDNPSSRIAVLSNQQTFAFVDTDEFSKVQIWSIHPLQPRFVLTLDGEDASFIFHLDWRKSTLVAFGDDSTLYSWNPINGQPLNHFSMDLVFDLSLSGDGKRMVLYSKEHGIHIRDTATGAILATLDTNDQ